MKKSILTALLSLLMISILLPTLASCGNTGSGDVTTAEPVAESTEAVPETTTDVFEDVNFDNAGFTYLAWKQGIDEYYAEEQDGDLIKDAIFKRNSHVTSALGVNLEFIELAGNSGSFKDFCKTASANILSGAHAYDALACYTRSASLLMIDGVLQNLLEVEYLDFSNPWWPDSLVNLNTIGDKLYFASGDIATSLLYQMMFMAINNNLAKDIGISGIQELALDGGWTLDVMLQTVASVYLDLNTNDKHDYADRYGLYTVTHPMLDIFYIGAGLKYVEINENGTPVLSEDYSSDASFDIIKKLQTLLWSGNTADGYFSTTGSDAQTMSSGNSLIYVLNGTNLQKYLRVAEFDYSILAAPKYTAEQENYYTAVGFPHSMYCIPNDASDLKMSGAVLEMMGRESYRQVTPVVFDTAFKYKYSNGAGDAEMFDLIRAGVVFDLGRTFFDQLGGDSSGPVRLWRNEVYNNTSSLASVMATYTKTWTRLLDESISDIKSK